MNSSEINKKLSSGVIMNEEMLQNSKEQKSVNSENSLSKSYTTKQVEVNDESPKIDIFHSSKHRRHIWIKPTKGKVNFVEAWESMPDEDEENPPIQIPMNQGDNQDVQ